ncbi:MAG: hypothetical protein WBA77_03775 [Microcoleaceae cyanobacterium]
MANLLDALEDESRFDKIKQGVNSLANTAEELAVEIPQVAESAMRMGYAYAKAEENLYSSIDLSKEDIIDVEEIIEADFEPIESNSSPVLDKEFLDNTDCWTKKALTSRFGNCTAAYQYLKDQYGFKFSRSWDKVIAAFNGELNHEVGLSPASNEVNLEKKVEILENTVKSQQQQIKGLEDKLNQVLQVLINVQK